MTAFDLPAIAMVGGLASVFSEPRQPTSDGQVWFFPPEMKQAVLNSDTSKVRAIKKQHADDLKANVNVIGEKAGHAFVQTVNKSTGQEYQLCETETGIVWTYVVNIQHIDAKAKATVCVGTFSKNAKCMGISTTTLNNLAINITAAVISTVVASVVGTFVSQLVGGAVYSAALAAAEAAAAGVLEAGGFMVAGALVGLAAFTAAVLAAIVVGVAFYFIVDAIDQSFGLEVNIYNWSRKEQWDVVEWHSDNAVLHNTDGKNEAFQQGNLKAISDVLALPDGTEAESKDLLASYAAYTFQNDSTWAQGLGIALKVVSKADPSRVLFLKYVVHWGKDNELDIHPGTGIPNLTEYYKATPWAAKGTYAAKTTIPASGSQPATTVIALTPALSGESSHLYTFDVHIDASEKS